MFSTLFLCSLTVFLSKTSSFYAAFLTRSLLKRGFNLLTVKITKSKEESFHLRSVQWFSQLVSFPAPVGFEWLHVKCSFSPCHQWKRSHSSFLQSGLIIWLVIVVSRVFFSAPLGNELSVCILGGWCYR